MSQQLQKLAYQKKLESIIDLDRQWSIVIQEAEWPELVQLLKQFSAFAIDYIDLLKQAPTSIGNSRFFLNTGLEKVLQEWSALSRACEQRLGPVDSGLPKSLKLARELMQSYCDRWHNVKRVAAPYLRLQKPVVYFEKLYRITRSIYAPQIPIVSIPLTDYGTDKSRWQALAHEFGHHIYWNALNLTATESMHNDLHNAIVEAFPALISSSKKEDAERVDILQDSINRVLLWGRWLEEIFADICGILFAGPTYALSAQNVAAEKIEKLEDFASDDQEHPCPYLRPLICLEVLYQVAGQSSSKSFQAALTNNGGLIEELKDRWLAFAQEANQERHTETGLTMETLATDIPAVVQAILNQRAWPGRQNLWDLIDFYGKAATKDDVGALDQLDRTALPKIPDEMSLSIQYFPKLDDIPDSFKSILEHLQNKVENADLEEALQPLTIWSMLLDLDLSDTHFHSSPHSCRRHWYYPWRHLHDRNTGRAISC